MKDGTYQVTIKLEMQLQNIENEEMAQKLVTEYIQELIEDESLSCEFKKLN